MLNLVYMFVSNLVLAFGSDSRARSTNKVTFAPIATIEIAPKYGRIATVVKQFLYSHALLNATSLYAES